MHNLVLNELNHLRFDIFQSRINVTTVTTGRSRISVRLLLMDGCYRRHKFTIYIATGSESFRWFAVVKQWCWLIGILSSIFQRSLSFQFFCGGNERIPITRRIVCSLPFGQVIIKVRFVTGWWRKCLISLLLHHRCVLDLSCRRY